MAGCQETRHVSKVAWRLLLGNKRLNGVSSAGAAPRKASLDPRKRISMRLTLSAVERRGPEVDFFAETPYLADMHSFLHLSCARLRCSTHRPMV